MSRPQIKYTGSLMADAAKCGTLRRFFPIPQISDLCYAFKQDYEQNRASFAALALNTVSPDDATAFLQNESDLQDQDGEVVKWTRSYYQVPPSWDDWDNIAYTFPQTPGYIVLPSGVSNPVGRNPFTPIDGAKCRIRRDYFMVGAGQTYANEGAIPEIAVQTYVGQLNPTFFLEPPQVVPAANLVVGTLLYLATVPSKETYFGWVANAKALGWASGRAGTADVNPGQIVISCKPERLVGNIWARVTPYILVR